MFAYFLIIALAAVSNASPVPDKRENIRYDQRQEGEFNLRADLENFVILLIPTSPSTPNPSPSPASGSSIGNISLLDLLSKSIPFKSYGKRNKHVKKDGQEELNDAETETMHFIESKTAPYHVDITKTHSHLSKLHPPASEDVLVAQSPTVSLVKSGEVEGSRLSRAVVITVPVETHEKKEVKKDNKKKHTKDVNGDVLKLLGAEHEQCGPGLTRDASGICRLNKA